MTSGESNPVFWTLRLEWNGYVVSWSLDGGKYDRLVSVSATGIYLPHSIDGDRDCAPV